MDQDDDEFPLPELPPSSPRSSPPPPSPRLCTQVALSGGRKRARPYSSSSNALPVFSSDDLADAGLENYAEPRLKRLHRRRWWEWEWECEGASARQQQQQQYAARRAVDSGVFLASDGSGSSADDGFSVQHLKISPPERTASLFVVPPRAWTGAPATAACGDELVREVVQRCLEDGKEVVDLSYVLCLHCCHGVVWTFERLIGGDDRNCNLQSVPSSMICSLQTLIREPSIIHHHTHSPSSSQEYYQPFTPRLKLFLSNNRLRELPGELVRLHGLTVLTLRNNEITELPQSVGRLVNLVELNVANNKLGWLPFELLELVRGQGKLANLHIAQNPFLRPTDDDGSPAAASWLRGPCSEHAAPRLRPASRRAEDRASEPTADAHSSIRTIWLDKIQKTLNDRKSAAAAASSASDSHLTMHQNDPIYLGSSAVTYVTLDGSPHRHSPQAPSALHQHHRHLAPAPFNPPPRTDHPSRVRSLFELASQACAASPPALADMQRLFGQAPECLPPLPPSLPRMLALASACAAEGGVRGGGGGRRCSAPACARAFVIPRAEWVEWWHCGGRTGGGSGSGGGAAALQAGDEPFTPFLRRVCSWACAVEAMGECRVEGDVEMAGLKAGLE